jgi:glucosamine--fructose-6-phosphate aminotransferase (isomerizing)
MCGIVGYIGNKQVLPILIDSLKRLEYRGYDSAGVAVLSDDRIKSVKSVGKIKNLQEKISVDGIKGCAGIAHTRWATHGEPSEANAHPHSDCKGNIWLVHNGIIENYQELKKELISSGHEFRSDTDTEVLAHLIESNYSGDLSEAVRKSLSLVKGAYGIAVIHKDEPTKIIAAKFGSPLVLGLGKDEIMLASDICAILAVTNQVVYLNDGELVEIDGVNHRIFNIDNEEIKTTVDSVEWDLGQAEKNGYPHFMLKEINEQVSTIVDSIRGRMIVKDGKVKLGGLDSIENVLRFIEKIKIIACGTAYNAGLIGRIMLEEYAGINCDVEQASEFRYRQAMIDQKTAVLAISQSGETADTLAAIKESKEKGALTLGIVNAVGSTIARETEAGVYNHIGPEIAVASTKAYTSQLAILVLFTVLFGRKRQMSMVMGKRILEELEQIPDKIKKIIEQVDEIKKIAEKYKNAKSFAFLGRKYNYPTALEGALKLKELSYIHAEGFPSGEMKHGSIAMIDPDFPSFFIAPRDSVYEKNISNMAEIKARQGRIIAVATEGDKEIEKVADDAIYIPKTLEMLTPILAVIPLQIFAYHMALLNNRDVDKPRNLAKSVTVE